MRQRWLALRLMLAGMLAAGALVVAPPVAFAATTITPSGMALTPSGAGGAFADSTTTSGMAIMLWSPGRFTMSVTTTARVALTVRARADLCSGSPILTATLDGVTVGAIDVASSGWADFSVGDNVSSGTHTLALEYANDYTDGTCDRNVYLDSVVVADGCPVGQYLARYFNNTNLTGTPVAARCENGPGGSFSGSPLTGVNADNFSVDYSGSIYFPATTNYAVSATLGNAGARLWLDNALVIDKWTAGTWGTTTLTRSVSAGVHQVRAAYFNTSGIAHFGVAAPQTLPGTASTNGNYFAADALWNTAIPVTATVDARSANWVSQLDSAVNGIGLNSSTWTTTVYNAPAGTATKQITITNASNKKVTVPYLSNYAPTTDTDAHLSIIDDATGCLYEFQGFNPATKTAIAQASYHVATGSGGHLAGPSHSGGELSYLAGMITPQDVTSGVINHALRYAMPGNAPTYVYPGTRSDGTLLGGVPEGTRLRLDPSLDLTPYGLTPFQTMVAKALQTYGGFNADSSSHFVLYARSTQDGTTYSQPLSDLPDSLIQHMQFLAPTVSSPDLYLDRSDDTTCNQQQ